MRTDLPTGTVTFLFTDVEGSTRLLDEVGAEGYADALSEHRGIVREACAVEDGVEVDTQGDAFFFAFFTAPGALRAAEAITESLTSGRIQVRMGLHTGTPLLTEEGYDGPSASASSVSDGAATLSWRSNSRTAQLGEPCDKEGEEPAGDICSLAKM